MITGLAIPMVLVMTVVAAVRHDLLERRIPNVLCACALAAGISLHVASDGWRGLAYAVSGGIVGLLALLPFYLLRGMGAGDVKLMAAVGSFLGPLGALLAAAATLMLGAVIAVGLVIRQRYWRKNRPSALIAARQEADRPAVSVLKKRFPYAVAIAGGTLLLMWYRGQFDQLAGALTG